MRSSGKLEYESRAKLMVSGEYLVLKGALSLALPLKYGQKLTVEVVEGRPMIQWISLINNNIWFTSTIHLPDFRVTDSNMPVLSDTLCQILKAARILNPGFLKSQEGYMVTSVMDFDPAWGIGSSSSLISNIAWWAGCDPFLLNRQIFNGSGYDIACARAEGPVVYHTKEDIPCVRKANFHPAFHRHLYFIYRNRKQSSKESIRDVDLSTLSARDIDTISELTLEMEKTENLRDFQRLIDRHEEFTSKIIHQTPVRQAHFNDFSGSVKSLGAWGGDFMLAASGASEEYVRNYFNNKNLTAIFNYNEIVFG
jgi:mevalonate kinase